jgi:hypothetical protein
MKFPDNSIGISDLVGYLECPQRAELGMRRHTGKAAPESWSPANAYGSAIHLGIHVLDETGDVEQAVTTAFREFKQWLDPDGLQLLRAIHEALGDDFFQIADLSRAAAERFYGKGAEELTIIDGYLEEGAPSYEAVLIT